MNKIVLEQVKSNSINLKDNERYLFKEDNINNARINVTTSAIIDIFNEKNIDINYVFNVDNNCKLILNIFDISENINRNIDININGEISEVIINISSISLKENNYVLNINHNNKNTSSKSNIHSLALDDNIVSIKNNGYVKKGSSKSNLIQDNKIILMGDNNSKIEPKLFIDEYDVDASHGAYIGKFLDDELFYLNSRGLNEIDSYRLLVTGFLIYEFDILDDDKNYLKEIISKYI